MLFGSRAGQFGRLLPLVIGGVMACIVTGCGDLDRDYFLGVAPPDEEDGGDGGGDANPGQDDDSDGLGNEVERTFEIDPRKADTDHDGFSDGIEFVVDSGDPLDGSVAPTSLNRVRVLEQEDAVRGDPDSDQDGLGDSFERRSGLDPNNSDTDGDGYQDGLELIANSDPFLPNDRPQRNAPPLSDNVDRFGQAPPDADRDGLSNDIEALNGTLTSNPDTDTDGFSDGIEFLAGSDPTDVLVIPNLAVPPAPQPTETP